MAADIHEQVHIRSSCHFILILWSVSGAPFSPEPSACQRGPARCPAQSVCVCVIIIWNRSRGQFGPWPFVLWSLNRTWNHRTVFLLSSWLTLTMVRSKSGEVIYFTIPGSMSDSGHVRPSSGHGHASANGEFGSSIGRYRYEHVWSVPFFFRRKEAGHYDEQLPGR